MAELLTTYAAGQRLGISSAAMLALVKRGAVPGAYRLPSRQVRIPPEVLDDIDPAAIEEARASLPPRPATRRPPPEPKPEPEPPPPEPEPVAVEPPEPEPEPTPPRADQDSSGPLGTPEPTRRRPRRPGDPLPGGGRVEITLEAVRGYRAEQDYGPEMLRVKAGLKVLLRRFGLRCKGLRFPDAEGEEVA